MSTNEESGGHCPPNAVPQAGIPASPPGAGQGEATIKELARIRRMYHHDPPREIVTLIRHIDHLTASRDWWQARANRLALATFDEVERTYDGVDDD